ncbi:glycoside hydrolase family 26 protein [Streptomyces cinereospinus]|uniref:Glycoside hydrolase family 26 protein n=1 Tax=Streptomyces cinereospinus TaxID=285561 RepID=A0ABV5N7D8_9ACTN
MAAQQRRARPRWPVCLAATLVASAALATGPGIALGLGVTVVPDPPAASSTAPTAPTPGRTGTRPSPPKPDVPGGPAAPSVPPVPSIPGLPSLPPIPPVPAVGSVKQFPAFGAYLHYGEPGVHRIEELSRWLGGADLRVGHTYLPGDLWSNIAGAPTFLEAWADWRNAADDRLFVLNVPMLERNEEGLSDAEVRALLRQGAAGEFDRHFRALAERLVELRVPDTVIVLGWEMNGITYSHRCGPDPQAWKQYWNRIVTAMRAVPGQRFRFDFTPSRGRDAVPWTRCYPGDDTVDVIGMDAYDQPAGLSFDEQVDEPYGLREHVEFARAHGKAISYPEWGLFRNGDNPAYVRGMLAWMDKHRPLYNTLTDYCPHGVWQCDDNPRAAAVYRTLLTGRTDAAAPQQPRPTRSAPASPTPTPRPTQPAQPAPVTPPAAAPDPCSPVELGDWVEHWLGGKPCVRLDGWSRIG